MYKPIVVAICKLAAILSFEMLKYIAFALNLTIIDAFDLHLTWMINSLSM